MNPDDGRSDGQDDETPEEMVNRSLAEALENQQRYMQMFQNSAHMLQVLSRFMSDPIVVHDLEIASDDGTTSSTSHSSPSPSMSSPPISSQPNKNDDTEPVVSHRMFGGCTDTVTLRDGRLRSARPQPYGRYRHTENASYVQRLRRAAESQNIELSVSRNENRESCSSIPHHEGAGDNASSKKDGDDQPNVSNLVAATCQTQSTAVSKTTVGVGTAKAIDSGAPTTTRPRESIGVATQTSIDHAMSEISKATDTIRRARTMLSALNIGTLSRVTDVQQMNNNNHKETEGSDRDDDATKELAQTGQGDVHKKHIRNSRQQEKSSPDKEEENEPGDTTSKTIKSIFVNVRPSDEVSISNGEEGSSLQKVETCDELATNKKQTTTHATDVPLTSRCDISQRGTDEAESNVNDKKRQRTTVTSRLGGAALSPECSDFDKKKASNEKQRRNEPPKLYAFETSKLPFHITQQPPVAVGADSAHGRLTLTVETFNEALKTAIGNLEKEGLWSSDAANTVNVKSDHMDSALPVSKIDTNCFSLVSPNMSQSTKELLLAPYCSSRSSSANCMNSFQNDSEMTLTGSTGIGNNQTNVVAFHTNCIQLSGDECSQSSMNFKEGDMEDERKQSDLESTYGHCSSIHLSPVMSFHEDTDEETNSEDISQENSRKNEISGGFTPRLPDSQADSNEHLKGSCRTGKAHDHFDKLGSGDSVPSMSRVQTAGVKPGENSQVTVPRQGGKQGFFRRLTTAIKLCSFKKK